MTEHEPIRTRIVTRNVEFARKRIERIKEAIAFEGGTIDEPRKHVISQLPNGKESYFFKPGKETLRKKPNIHDMTPNVGANGTSETLGWPFEKILEYLLKISLIHQATFKKVLVLLYRNCFLLDHQEIVRGIVRYRPAEEISEYIDNLEAFVLKDGFKDKFRTTEIGLLEFLHFIDLLAWNEDVKYHVVEGQPDFKKYEKNVGRINTVLSVISAPLLISNFIQDIIYKTQHNGIIDVKLITATIQRFTKTRGMCVIPNKELVAHLAPYLVDGNE